MRPAQRPDQYNEASDSKASYRVLKQDGCPEAYLPLLWRRARPDCGGMDGEDRWEWQMREHSTVLPGRERWQAAVQVSAVSDTLVLAQGAFTTGPQGSMLLLCSCD